MKKPKTRHQTPKKRQAPNSKQHRVCGRPEFLTLEVWSLFGVWCLVFGAF
jgi:hypothetical protein